jgi:hypothetical protein
MDSGASWLKNLRLDGGFKIQEVQGLKRIKQD